MKDKEIIYAGKGLLAQIENADSWDYDILLENARVSVKFTEVSTYSAFTPYEFGNVPKRVIVDGVHAVKVTEYLTSPGAGTVLYFDKCVKDKINLNEFYTVTIYSQPIFYESYRRTIDQILHGSIGFRRTRK